MAAVAVETKESRVKETTAKVNLRRSKIICVFLFGKCGFQSTTVDSTVNCQAWETSKSIKPTFRAFDIRFIALSESLLTFTEWINAFSVYLEGNEKQKAIDLASEVSMLHKNRAEYAQSLEWLKKVQQLEPALPVR